MFINYEILSIFPFVVTPMAQGGIRASLMHKNVGHMNNGHGWQPQFLLHLFQ